MCHGPFVGLETEEEAVPGLRTQQAVVLRGRKRWGGGGGNRADLRAGLRQLPLLLAERDLSAEEGPHTTLPAALRNLQSGQKNVFMCLWVYAPFHFVFW